MIPGAIRTNRIAITLIALLVALPVITVLLQVGNITSENWNHLLENLLASYAWNSLLVVLGVAVFALVFGVLPAWWISIANFPFRKYLDWLLILPLSIPTFINGITYSGLTDYTGPIRSGLRNGGFADLPIDILNVPGVIFSMSTVLFPYVYLTSRAVFSLQSASHIEAARMLGASPFRIFFKVALPMAWPGIFAGLMLVIMEVLNDYGTVHYFGVSTFTTGIFKSWLSLGDLPSAVLLSLILMSFVLLLVFIEGRINKRKQFAASQQPLAKIVLKGSRKWLVMTLCSVPFVLGFIIPVAQLIYWAVLSWDRTNWDRIFGAILNSIQVSVLAGIFLVLLAWGFAYLQRCERRSSFSGFMGRIAILGYSMPGAVIGIGVVSLVLWIEPSWLFASTIALMIGFMTRFFAVGQNAIVGGYEKVPMSIDESSRVLGKTSWTLVCELHFPLLRPALFAGLIMVIIDVIKELPITLILRPFNFETLSTQAFQFAKDEMAAQSAIPALLIIIISAIPVYFLNRIFIRS